MLLCFDFDGVLADSFEFMLDLVVDVQQELGCGRAPTADDLRVVRPLTFKGLGEYVDMAEPDAEQFAQKALQELRIRNSRFHSVAGMNKAIMQLGDTHTLVVITSRESSNTDQELRRLRIDSIRTTMGAELGISKAERLMRCCREFGISPSNTMMIGDAASDFDDLHPDVISVAVTWGYQSRQLLEEAKPKLMINDPQQLCSIVARLSATY